MSRFGAIISPDDRSSRPEMFFKKVFLKISQDLLENAYVGLSLLRKRLRHRFFLVNFAKFLRSAFLTEHLVYN